MPLNAEQTTELARLRASRDSWEAALAAGADGLASFTIVTPSGTTRAMARRSTREIMDVIGTLNVKINHLVELEKDQTPGYAGGVVVSTARDDESGYDYLR